ncbi:MAG: rod shape-determining protein MreD, partial [Melioribacteraceae bacterium]
QVYGTILGSIFGLLFDIVSGGIIGTAMFSMTLSGFIAGYFYSENKIEIPSTVMFILIVFICSFVNSFVFLLLSSSEIKLTISHLVLEQGVLPAIFTATISLPLLLFNQKKKYL